MTAANQYHAGVKSNRRNETEVDDGGAADDSATEVINGREIPVLEITEAMARLGPNESASEAKAKGALKREPRMKPTVRLPVRNDATMPIASMDSPTNQ